MDHLELYDLNGRYPTLALTLNIDPVRRNIATASGKLRSRPIQDCPYVNGGLLHCIHLAKQCELIYLRSKSGKLTGHFADLHSESFKYSDGLLDLITVALSNVNSLG